MTFVPYVPPPLPPSPKTQELSRRLQAAIESFRHENPDVTEAEVRAALLIAIALGLVVLGLVAFLFVIRASSRGGTPPVMAMLVAAGIVTVAVALLLRAR